ncbi:MAG: hypothetical protein HY901_10685 [Deltaproteobacteria bacterium]|nr:hypothetical protein [Deltaproteobacteria bacterium]
MPETNAAVATVVNTTPNSQEIAMSEASLPSPVSNTIAAPEETPMSASISPISPSTVLVNPDDSRMRALVDKFLAEAVEAKFPVLIKCRDPELASRNATFGVASVNTPELVARMAEELPKVDRVRLLAIGDLADAVAYEARHESSDEPTMRAMLKRAGELRRMLLPQMQVLMFAGICPKAEYERLKSSRGAIAFGTSLLDMVEFLDQRTKVEGKVALDAKVIAEARAMGKFIRENVRMPTQRKDGRPAQVTAAPASDLLFTLLVRRHDDLRAVAYWFWRGEMNTYVPPLLAKVRAKAKKSAAEVVEAVTQPVTQPPTVSAPPSM